MISRKLLFQELFNLTPFSSKSKEYSKLNEALKTLKKRGQVTQSSRGFFIFGGTHGGANLGVDLETTEAQGRRWLSEAPYFHNIQGRVVVSNWGSMPGPNHRPDPVPLPCGGYVRLQRQHSSLQFYLAYKRPGFSRGDLIVAFQGLRSELMKYGVHGETFVQQFEARNERAEVVGRLRRRQNNPFQLELVEGLLARAYYDETKGTTNFELRQSRIEWTDAEFFNCVNAMDTTAKSMRAMEVIDRGVATSIARLQTLGQLTEQHMQRCERVGEDYLSGLGRSTTMLTDIEEKLGELVVGANTSANGLGRVERVVREGIEEFNAGLDVFAEEYLGESSKGSRDVVAAVNAMRADVVQHQREQIHQSGLLAAELRDQGVERRQQLEEIRQSVGDVHMDLVSWREVESSQRSQVIQELRDQGKSWRQISRHLDTSLSTVYSWAKRNLLGANTNANGLGRVENISGVISEEIGGWSEPELVVGANTSTNGSGIRDVDEYLLQNILVILRQVGGSTTQTIVDSVRRRRQLVSDHLEILAHLHVISKERIGRSKIWRLIS